MASPAPIRALAGDPRALPRPLHRVVERYIRAFAPERIVLFGSRAKGTDHEGSDADLLVIADLQGDPASHLRRAHQLAADCFPPVDVVFATSEEVAEAATAELPFLLSILGSGITVYRRPEGVRSLQDAGGGAPGSPPSAGSTPAPSRPTRPGPVAGIPSGGSVDPRRREVRSSSGSRCR